MFSVGGHQRIPLKPGYPVKRAASAHPEISQHVRQTSRLGSFHLLCLAAEQSTGGEQPNQYNCFFRSQRIFPVFSSLWNFQICFVHISFLARCTRANWTRTEPGERGSKRLLAFRDWPSQHLQAGTINVTITACDTACSFSCSCSLAEANKMQVYAQVFIFE